MIDGECLHLREVPRGPDVVTEIKYKRDTSSLRSRQTSQENRLGLAAPANSMFLSGALMADPRDVSVSALLSKIDCAMVDRPELVVIKTNVPEEGASLAIEVHRDDIGKIIGKQGRSAKLLRIP